MLKYVFHRINVLIILFVEILVFIFTLQLH